jgi:hypothetical protein
MALIALMLAMVLGYVIYLRYAIENRIDEAFGGPTAASAEPSTEPGADSTPTCFPRGSGWQPYC